jgi:hypothetical protein
MMIRKKLTQQKLIDSKKKLRFLKIGMRYISTHTITWIVKIADRFRIMYTYIGLLESYFFNCQVWSFRFYLYKLALHVHVPMKYSIISRINKGMAD